MLQPESIKEEENKNENRKKKIQHHHHYHHQLSTTTTIVVVVMKLSKDNDRWVNRKAASAATAAAAAAPLAIKESKKVFETTKATSLLASKLRSLTHLVCLLKNIWPSDWVTDSLSEWWFFFGCLFVASYWCYSAEVCSAFHHYSMQFRNFVSNQSALEFKLKKWFECLKAALASET